MTDKSQSGLSCVNDPAALAPGAPNMLPHRKFSTADTFPTEPGILECVDRWFRSELPCIAGRREFNKNRYMIRLGAHGRIGEIISEFAEGLIGGQVTACFLVFDAPRSQMSQPASVTFRWLAETMSEISTSSAEALCSGSPLSLEFALRCPVTGQVTCFDDFECIAFCPQSSDEEDPLYDPLMYAPFPAVNISSDVYAFSVFVRDACLRRFGVEPVDVADIRALFAFFYECAEKWHVIASRTIENFSRTVSDQKRCPVRMTEDRTHWIAWHQDPAFAEASKSPHIHELPALYATRICDAWIEHFTHRSTYSPTGMARAGISSRDSQ
jgi:hypothetical protein